MDFHYKEYLQMKNTQIQNEHIDYCYLIRNLALLIFVEFFSQNVFSSHLFFK